MKTTATVPASFIADLTQRWRAGERLPALGKVASEVLKRHVAPVTVRGWVIKELGGAEAFQQASVARDVEHPRRKPQPPRAARVKDPSRFADWGGPPAIDDSTVPVVKGTPVKEGWGSTSVRIRGRAEDVLVAPDGTRYLHAGSNERADLIVDLSHKRLGLVRLRLEQTSGKARAARREERLVVRAEKHRRGRKSAENMTKETLGFVESPTTHPA